MKPSRVKELNGVLIEEFYWGREYVVYVNNRLFEGDFEQAIKQYIR